MWEDIEVLAGSNIINIVIFLLSIMLCFHRIACLLILGTKHFEHSSSACLKRIMVNLHLILIARSSG